MNRIAVYALGGHALESTSSSDRTESALVMAKVVSDIIDLLENNWRVVITHGNGPQVGRLLSMDEHEHHSMDEWVAATQGMIGHTLSLHLNSIFRQRERAEHCVALLTHVMVKRDDHGFEFPTKPVGKILTSSEVMSKDWDIAQTVNGPRRVVASPSPGAIIELEAIRQLLHLGVVVIAGGGGGIPIVDDGEDWYGVPAVIDKDLLSAEIANQIDASALFITTDVEAIYTQYGTSQAKAHRIITTKQLEQFQENGEFPTGSMLPKTRALQAFVHQHENRTSILCQPGEVLAALRGQAGTTVVNT